MARDIIAAGDYAIRTEGSGQLVAHLGTCVGVAIHDKENGIGGVAHFLLSDPYGPIPTSQTFSYASSGLPLFIDLLKQSGASLENMEVVVAGGSLVGPVSDLDVNLDIGGRTAERVMQILHDHNLKVLLSETGGWHGCRLTYDIESGTCEVTYFERDDHEHESSSSSLPPRLEEGDVDEAIATVNPIPQTVLKLIRMISEGDYEMRDIAKNVRQDQVLSARVLNLCNSAFFARRSRISSIDTALVLLGERSFIQMILSASVESFYNDVHDGYSLVKGGLFFHALGTAIVSEKIASVVKKIDPSIAYTSGLLHDIGKVVLDQFIARRWSVFYRAVKDPSVNLLDFERKLVGANHVEIGIRLGKEWALPDELISVIAHHHRPLEADLEPRLVAIVSLADLLMSRFQVGLELERFSTVDLEGVLDILDIQPDEFQKIVMEIPWSDFGALLSYESASANEGTRPL